MGRVGSYWKLGGTVFHTSVWLRFGRVLVIPGFQGLALHCCFCIQVVFSLEL